MLTLLKKRWRFNGGIRLDDHKTAGHNSPIATLPLPQRLRVQLHQHQGDASEPIVAVGERVLKGQPLTSADHAQSALVHAPASGTVTRIAAMPVPHVSGLPSRCVEIETDGQEDWVERHPVANFQRLARNEITSRLHQLGVVGQGGALFPSASKLATAANIDTLIINAAECEPYISCDQALITERAAEIITGIAIARQALNAQQVLLGIEDNKPAAIKAIQSAIKNADSSIRLCTVPTIYPSGGEKQLIKVLTGREVPSGGLPAALGICMLNVATAYSIYRAICLGEPVISRIVTVSGDAVVRPRNVEALIGTPIHELIANCGGYTAAAPELPGQERTGRELTMGGPMMGFALPDDELPVIKSTNCLLVRTRETSPVRPVERPCIRCGLCAQVCPATLLPQQLHWYAKARDLPKLQQYHVADCIECGACEYVCPSRIPLVHYYRYAKSEIAAEAQNRQEAAAARLRFAAREARLAAIKRGREEKMAKKRAALEASKKARRGQSSATQQTDPKQVNRKKADNQQDVIAAALARAKAKKAAMADDKDGNRAV